MSELNLGTSVGEWVARRPCTSRVFEALSIDYCCGGDKSLDQACSDRQIDALDVLEQLQEAASNPEQAPERTWMEAPLSDLCDHIEETHHAYLRGELPRLTELIETVVRAHRSAHPELVELRQAFSTLRDELEPHMFKEEQILFPAIRQMENSQQRPSFPFGSVANPIRMMEHEHDNAGGALSELRRLTEGFLVPEGACSTYVAMLDGLRELEHDMHQHVHKENNILFPRSQRLEEANQTGA